MQMRSALIVIGACTAFVGLTAFATSALQEQVSTCETRLNNTQLQVINGLQRISSNELKIVHQVLAKQIEVATGVPGPTDPGMEDAFRSALELNQRLMRDTEAMQALLEEGCEEQRQQWFLFSMISVMVNALIACLAFWLGLRVVDQNRSVRDSE